MSPFAALGVRCLPQLGHAALDRLQQRVGLLLHPLQPRAVGGRWLLAGMEAPVHVHPPEAEDGLEDRYRRGATAR